MSIFKKKAKITVTPKDPVFYVRLIGSVETFQACGKGCMRLPIQKIWDGSGEEQHMKRVALTLSSEGIRMKDLENKKSKEQLFGIRYVTYCNADTEIKRVFGWIYKHPDGKKIECFGALCNSPEKAQAMALVLSRAFQIAYKDYKREQSRTKRRSKTERSLSQSSFSEENTQANGSTDNSTNGSVTGSDEQHAETAELTVDLFDMNITQDDSSSQCSSENNARIIEEDTEEQLSHNAAVQALAMGDTSPDDVDGNKKK